MAENRKNLSRSAALIAGMAILALLPTSQAKAAASHFDAVINTTNPCTGSPEQIHGTTTLSVTAYGRRVIVHEHFFGREHGYDVHYHGEGEFPAPQPSYYIHVQGGFDGPSLFESRAIDRVFADDGFSPTGDRFVRIRNFCR
jgi:hypothetical protein